MVVEYSEFKGNKMIVLKRTEQDTFPFQFGLGKAKLIIDNIDAIQEFYDKNFVAKTDEQQ